VVASATARIYTDAHAAACRQIADLIGPFIETVVWLHCERRHRERLKGVTGLAPILGASLKVGDVLERLGEAVRPLIDFEVMGLTLLSATGQGFERIGVIGGPRALQRSPPRIEDYSVLERVSRVEIAGAIAAHSPSGSSARYSPQCTVASSHQPQLLAGQREVEEGVGHLTVEGHRIPTEQPRPPRTR